MVKNIYRNVFKTAEVSKPPWPRMILCALATMVPIGWGWLHGELAIAVFGGLVGHLLSLNDHLGDLKHRLWVTTLSAVILAAGFWLGLQLSHVEGSSGSVFSYYLVVGLVSYWLGLLGGDGAELERAVLFALIGFISSFTTPTLTPDLIPRIIPYALIGYVCLMIGGPVIYFVGRYEAIAGHASLRHSLRRSFTKRLEKHIHAICFVLMVLVSVWISGRIGIGHASWITITVLIILRPDRTLTVYKTLQRFFGTLVGVLVADVIVMLHPQVAMMIAILGICAFVIPWAVLKNYWISSFFVTVFVVMLLELAARHGTLHVATLRLEATSIGCALSLIGVGLSRMMDRAAGVSA